MKKKQKGFTLIELLVVIAIIAVLATVVILSLNPAELLRQSRDSNRVSDMATLKSALALYLADVSSPNLASSSVAGCTGANGYKCSYFSFNPNQPTTAASSGLTTAALAASSTGSTSTAVDATGWLPVNFTAISSGAPIGTLPRDPVNASSSFDPYNDPLIYGYAATTTNYGFKIVAHMESTKYSTGTTGVQANDGGGSATAYEQGTLLSL